VDVCSLLARGLDLMKNARETAPQEVKTMKPFRRQWRESGSVEDVDLVRKRREWYS